MENNEEIEIKEEYINAYRAVRDSGRTNMLDSNMVLYIMNEMEFYETVLWLVDTSREGEYIRADRKKYAALIRAFEAPYKVMEALTTDYKR